MPFSNNHFIPVSQMWKEPQTSKPVSGHQGESQGVPNSDKILAQATAVIRIPIREHCRKMKHKMVVVLFLI